MTQKPETKFYKKLKSLTPEIHWTRFESLVSPGVPDLHGIFPTEWGHSISFWIELKCSEMKKVHLTPRQISWNFSYNKAGGNNFILVFLTFSYPLVATFKEDMAFFMAVPYPMK